MKPLYIVIQLSIILIACQIDSGSNKKQEIGLKPTLSEEQKSSENLTTKLSSNQKASFDAFDILQF